MRLWTIHPKYLDSRGLVALWRESLLAKAVLEGKTRGYTNHPQLIRFKKFKLPLNAINKYLSEIYTESEKRGYKFDKSKFKKIKIVEKVDVTSGQVNYEINHLKLKLEKRDVDWIKKLSINAPDVFSIFNIKNGDVEEWEKV